MEYVNRGDHIMHKLRRLPLTRRETHSRNTGPAKISNSIGTIDKMIGEGE